MKEAELPLHFSASKRNITVCILCRCTDGPATTGPDSCVPYVYKYTPPVGYCQDLPPYPERRTIKARFPRFPIDSAVVAVYEQGTVLAW
jgi:hypothetical protein